MFVFFWCVSTQEFLYNEYLSVQIAALQGIQMFNFIRQCQIHSSVVVPIYLTLAFNFLKESSLIQVFAIT